MLGSAKWGGDRCIVSMTMGENTIVNHTTEHVLTLRQVQENQFYKLTGGVPE